MYKLLNLLVLPLKLCGFSLDFLKLVLFPPFVFPFLFSFLCVPFLPYFLFLSTPLHSFIHYICLSSVFFLRSAISFIYFIRSFVRSFVRSCFFSFSLYFSFSFFLSSFFLSFFLSFLLAFLLACCFLVLSFNRSWNFFFLAFYVVSIVNYTASHVENACGRCPGIRRSSMIHARFCVYSASTRRYHDR